MIEPRISLSAAGMASMFKAFGNVFKKEYNKILLESAKDTAESLAKRSYPTTSGNPAQGGGNTPEAMAHGEANVRRDLYGMFRPLESFSVRELVRQKNMAVFDLANPIDWKDDDLRKAWENRDMEILYNTFSRLTTHVGEADEFEYGEQEEQLEEIPYVAMPTIQDQQKMMRNGRWDKQSKMLVKNRAVLAKFVAQRLRSVGTVVNGWVKIAQQLRGSIAKIMPGKGEGSAKFRSAKGGGEWILTNKYGNPNGMLSHVMQEVAAEEQQNLQKKAYDLVKRCVAAANAQRRAPRPSNAPTPTP